MSTDLGSGYAATSIGSLVERQENGPGLMSLLDVLSYSSRKTNRGRTARRLVRLSASSHLPSGLTVRTRGYGVQMWRGVLHMMPQPVVCESRIRVRRVCVKYEFYKCIISLTHSLLKNSRKSALIPHAPTPASGMYFTHENGNRERPCDWYKGQTRCISAYQTRGSSLKQGIVTPHSVALCNRLTAYQHPH